MRVIGTVHSEASAAGRHKEPRRGEGNHAPLPIPKKPHFDEAFRIIGQCIQEYHLLRVAQHTIIS